MKTLRILALMHEDLVPPEDVAGRRRRPRSTGRWSSTSPSRCANARPRGAARSASATTSASSARAIDERQPHVVFNLLEDFHGVPIFDQNVVSYLELLRIPYTGCNPRGLMLARDKALSKKLLAYHRIPVPEFAVFPHRPRGAAAEAADLPADRQVAHRARPRPASRRRRVVDDDEQAGRARALHPRDARHRRDRRALHRRPRALRRHPRQPAPAGVPGLGAALHQDARRAVAHRHRPGEVEPRLPEEARHQDRRGQGPARRRRRAASSTSASASIARST